MVNFPIRRQGYIILKQANNQPVSKYLLEKPSSSVLRPLRAQTKILTSFHAKHLQLSIEEEPPNE